jgi:hypothetical protein
VVWRLLPPSLSFPPPSHLPSRQSVRRSVRASHRWRCVGLVDDDGVGAAEVDVAWPVAHLVPRAVWICDDDPQVCAAVAPGTPHSQSAAAHSAPRGSGARASQPGKSSLKPTGCTIGPVWHAEQGAGSLLGNHQQDPHFSNKCCRRAGQPGAGVRLADLMERWQ